MDCGILASRGQYGQSFAVESKVLYLGETAADQSCYQHKFQTEKKKVQFVSGPCRLYYKLKPSCSFIFFSPGSWLIFQFQCMATVLVKWYMRSPQTLYFDATEVWCTKIQINIQLVNKPLSYTIHMNKENSYSITTFKCVTKLFFSL